MLGALEPGDHVKAGRDITSGFLGALSASPTVRRGQRGIVREVRHGWWSSTCTVEFETGWSTLTVRGVDTRSLRRGFGGGEASWRRRQELRRGVKLGLLAANVPLVIAVVLYLVRGADPVSLVLAAAAALATTVVALAVAHPVLTVVFVGVAAFVARRRVRP